MYDATNRNSNTSDDEAKDAQRKLKHRESAKFSARRKKAAEAAKDVRIAELQAKNTTDATRIEKLVFAQQVTKRKQAEMSETIEQLTVKVRAKIASLLDAITLASFAGYEG